MTFANFSARDFIRDAGMLDTFLNYDRELCFFQDAYVVKLLIFYHDRNIFGWNIILEMIK